MKIFELKNIIKGEINKLLKEIYDKNQIGDQYGEGLEHTVYNYGKDKIIKFADSISPNNKGLQPNAKILANYPNIFPKVYNIGSDYIIMEKLDDNKAYVELFKIKQQLSSNNKKYISSDIPPKNQYITKLMQKSKIDGSNYYDYDISTLIYDNLEDNELKSQLRKELSSDLYNSLIKNWYPLLQKIKNIPWSLKKEKDVHDENFGYTLKGELKMIDI